MIRATIYLRDFYDGPFNVAGTFLITDSKWSPQSLVVSAVGYPSYERPLRLDQDSVYISIILRKAINKMNGVRITTGPRDERQEERIDAQVPRNCDRCRGSQ